MAARNEKTDIVGAGVIFLLPDGRVVLQRRTKDAPYNPGLLALFGGGTEAGETSAATIKREIAEETNLLLTNIEFEHKAEIHLSAQESKHHRPERVSVYMAKIPTADFMVFEGADAEAYTLKELWERDDLTVSTRKALDKVFGGKDGTQHN